MRQVVLHMLKPEALVRTRKAVVRCGKNFGYPDFAIGRSRESQSHESNVQSCIVTVT